MYPTAIIVDLPLETGPTRLRSISSRWPPNILVMDGTLSRANATEATWAEEALTSPYVDLYSNHYYDVDLIKPMNFYKMSNDSNWIRKYGKTFIVGGAWILPLYRAVARLFPASTYDSNSRVHGLGLTSAQCRRRFRYAW